MKSDRPIEDTNADATRQWMDGLAGRPGTGLAHGEGARLRSALEPDERDSVQATWRDIEARAGVDATDDTGSWPAHAAPRAVATTATEAANQASPWRRYGWAAVVVLGLALAVSMPLREPESGETLRGAGGQGTQGALWRVDRPVEAAEALAAELRALQAEVAVTRDGTGARLHIQAPPGAVHAVNARLAQLETGLDAQGLLQLDVVPIR